MKINKTYVIAAVSVLGAALLIGGKLAANKDKFKSEVEISQRRVDKIPVSVDTIQIGSLSDNVKTTGTLEASAVLNLVSETQGKIIKIYRKKEIMYLPALLLPRLMTRLSRLMFLLQRQIMLRCNRILSVYPALLQKMQLPREIWNRLRSA